jgi:hypothetical protein
MATLLDLQLGWQTGKHLGLLMDWQLGWQRGKHLVQGFL